MPRSESSARRLDAGFAGEQLPPRVIGDEPLKRPLRVGVISNPQSGQNSRRGLLTHVRELLQDHPQVANFDEDTVDGMVRAVEQMVERETEIIVINGGDGTVQAVLTALFNTPADALPLVAVLPGGTTNTTSHNVGFGKRALPSLQRILSEARHGRVPGRVERRAVLCVERNGDRRYAMMFGAGGIYHGILLARGPIESTGLRGELGASLALATFLWKVVSGSGGTLFPALEAEIRVDGELVPHEPYLGVIGSTMDRTILGLHTYWGVGDGPVRFTSLRCAPRHLAGALVSIVRGVQRPYMRPELGYRSVNADEVRLAFNSGYTLDGELFAAGDDGRNEVTLSGRQFAYFLRAQP
jgi:hypothetical protein